MDTGGKNTNKLTEMMKSNHEQVNVNITNVVSTRLEKSNELVLSQCRRRSSEIKGTNGFKHWKVQ